MTVFHHHDKYLGVCATDVSHSEGAAADQMSGSGFSECYSHVAP